MKQSPLIHSLWLAALLLLAVSCEHDEISLPQPPAGDAVSFRTETLDDFTTRSAGYTTTGTYAVRSIGIYAGYTSSDWDGTTAPNNFFDNLHISRTDDASPWTYSNEELWPGSGKLSFFAYAPHRDNPVYGTGADTNKPTITVGTGTPTLQYTIAPSHDKQVDLLVATPQLNQTKRDYVTLPLRHALTKIAFSARVANAPATDVQIRVTSIQLSGFYGSGSIAMNGQNRQWTPSGANNHSYTQTNGTGGGLKPLPLTDTYQSLTPTDGHLFLLPQAPAEGGKGTGATITVTYETQVGTNAPDVKSFDLELSRAISRLNPGDAYNLMFTIDNGVTFIVAPTPWNNTEVKADIKNRILNVTRIEANVYPGAATRIYFWSNQPKDSVYVRKEGNIDAAKYPTGAPYTVNTLFLKLSGATAANLHYPGFDGITTTSGEGYIDVLMRNNTTVPYSPILADGDKRHIWLNASGLTRNILLNAIVKGNLTTTPYVGTFHRWNETGERIVTWAYNLNWTAKVDTEGGAFEDVLIDKLPSPFMATGQLYAAGGNVGDPEAASLDSSIGFNISNPPSVQDSGRIYFRVGWRKRLDDRTRTRYARIKVEGYNIGGNGKHGIFLYLRQGESEDYLYDYDAAERPAATKWSPYNLTVSGLNAGGSVQVAANRTNARFVQYPTQAGGIYKWVNPVLTDRPTAYSPVGTITGWSVNNYNGFWYPVMSQQESCPPGYRRPNRGSISASVSPGVKVDAEILHSLFEQIDYTSATNKPSNSLWGYYADGFFDRRNIENAIGDIDSGTACAVESSSASVGYIGRLFYNPSDLLTRVSTPNTPPASLFFPAAGYRSDQKQHKNGLEGQYWSSTGETYSSNTLGWNLVIGAGTTANTQTSNLHGMSIRCVREIIFGTDLPPYDETGVPTALSFDADARNATPAPAPVNALFVAKWNTTMARDFRLYTEPDGTGKDVIRKIAAKVTFRGTTATGNHTVDTNLFASALGKVGSTVTYAFNHAELTWAAGTTFSFDVYEGWTATRYLGSSNTADASGTVVGPADTSVPIVLSQKGRIVFTRTTPPVKP